MARREKPPVPIVKKTKRGLLPVSAYDSEQVMSDALDTEYDLVKRTRRSNQQLRLYWQALTSVVRSTGKWPTKELLHDELRFVCGFRRNIVDWDTGRVTQVLDSTALDAMEPDDFRTYFDMAMSKLAEHVGFDPLAFVEAA